MNLRMRLIVGDRVLIAVAFVAIAATANIGGRFLVNIYCALEQFWCAITVSALRDLVRWRLKADAESSMWQSGGNAG